MEFTYFKKTGELYRDTPFGKEWDGDDGYNFSYEPEEKAFKEKLKQLVEEEYGNKAWKLVDDFGLFEEVAQKELKQAKETFYLATIGAVELFKRADEKEVKDIVASLDDCKKTMLYYRDVVKNMQEDNYENS